jgi:predicted amidohydrolase
MSHSSLTVALITEVFFDDPESERLSLRLAEARSSGAELVVLPELPMDPWVPTSCEPDPADAEEPAGRRHQTLAAAARSAGVAVLGGAIVRDPASGRRHNTALLFDDKGSLSASYSKIHLPYEEDFWEAAHYKPGTDPPEVFTGLSLPMGIQICSDANRSSGCQLLAAQGAAVVFVPRATPAENWHRWRLVLRANAITSAVWVVTVNRPPVGKISPIGGPSAVIAPNGELVCETTDAIAVVRLDGDAVAQARRAYPGYLDFHPAVYAKAWNSIAARPPRSPEGHDQN